MYMPRTGIPSVSAFMRETSSSTVMSTSLFSDLTYTFSCPDSISISPMTAAYEHQSCFERRTFLPTVASVSSTETRMPAERTASATFRVSATHSSFFAMSLTCSGAIHTGRYPGTPVFSRATAVSSKVYIHLSMEPMTAQWSITGYCFSPFSSE